MRFLFCTDGHLSTKRPIARTEKTDSEYIDNQLAKRKQMLEYARANNIENIFDGGDFLQYWRMDNSSELVAKTFDLFNQYKDIYYGLNIGNHDLPYHDINNVDQSLLGVFKRMGIINLNTKILFTDAYMILVPYSADLSKVDTSSEMPIVIAVIHENIFEHKVPPYMTGYTADELLDIMPNVDLFLCGHNHEQFIVTRRGRTVVNGGSIMRLNTKQKDYRPKFYDIEIKDDKITVNDIDFDILPDMISDEHLRNKKIQTFVESTQDFADGSENFDFYKDVEIEMNKRKTKIEVKVIVQECLGDR